VIDRNAERLLRLVEDLLLAAQTSAGNLALEKGELDVAFHEETQTFSYVQPDRDGEPIELAPEPSWNRVAYRT